MTMSDKGDRKKKAVNEVESKPDGKKVSLNDGIHYVFRFKDPKTGLYVVADDGDEAIRAVGDEFDLVRAHVTDGRIDRIFPQKGRSPETPVANVGNARSVEHPEHGLGIAFLCTDPISGVTKLTADETLARLAGEDRKLVWAFYKEGKIDHPATSDEYTDELEIRIGRRMAEKLSKEELFEFNRLIDTGEALDWLKAKIPNCFDIVSEVRQEMRRAIVME